jgi:hypothetical protein
MQTRAEVVTTVDLGYEQLFTFDGGPHSRVRVLYGATWLTEEGQTGDSVVVAGGELALHGGRAVAEGLVPTRLQIVEPRPRSVARRAGPWLRQAARDLRRLLARLQLGAAAEPNA